MKKKCKGNYGKDLSPETRKFSAGSEQSYFNISVGGWYSIHGMLLNQDNVLKYLVINDYKIPAWVPAELFENSVSLLPAEWYFADHPQHQVSIWGYKLLVENLDHFDGLLDGDEEALSYFFQMIQKDS
jgi:hypothetical protein